MFRGSKSSLKPPRPTASPKGLWRGAKGRFAGDERGAAAVVVALSMSGLLGFAALATDVGVWYADLRSVQGATDAAAYSASVEYQNSGSITDAQDVAKAVAGQGGFVNGAGGVTVTVNMPPTAGGYKGVTGAAEVIIAKRETLVFSTGFLQTAIARSRAVAMPGSAGSGSFCALALDANAETGLTINGAVALNLGSCGLYVDASGANAMVTKGGAVALTAGALSVVGGVSSAGHPAINVTGQSNIGTASVLTDPYASTPVPAAGPCASGPVSGVFSPGTYCSGISLTGGTSTLSPGVYVIPVGQSFSLAGNAVVNGTGGVTIILEGSSANAASVSVAGTSTLNLKAPTSGTYAGLAIFQDPKAPSTLGVANSFGGNSTVNVTGAMDFSNQDVTFAGVPTTSTCTQLIAWQITFSGASTLNSVCAGDGTKSITTATTSKLVE